MKYKRFLALLMATGLIISMLSGCGSTESANEAEEETTEAAEEESTTPDSNTVATETGGQAEEATEETTYKDTIIYAHSTDATILNPNNQNGTNTESVVLLCYNSLLKFDENFNVVGDLAEEWSVADDQVTWTFKLKQGVKFHNGKEMTANDFKATYDYYMNPDNGVTNASLSVLSAVNVIDDYTLELVTKEPYGVMERTFCDIETAVQDSDYIEKYGSELGTTIESVNGTGPYKPVNWVKDSEIDLERNEDYFGEIGGTKNIVFQVIPDASARKVALETGEVDIAMDLSAEDIAAIESDTDGDLKVVKRLTVNQRLFRFGCNDEIMSNSKVRQALIYAIDREAVINALFKGLGQEPTCSVSTLTFGYKDLGTIERDVDKAKELLKEAGYPDGFNTKIVTTERYANGVKLAELLGSQFEEIGVHCEIETREWSDYSTAFMQDPQDKFDMPIFIMGGGYGSADCDGELRACFGDWADETARKNYGFYHNDEVSTLLKEAAVETDQAKREEMYNRVNEIIYLEDPGAIWIYDQYQVIATTTGTEGFTYLPNAVLNLTYVTTTE